VPASLGIPVTHREFARGVTFVTGHTKDGTEPRWQALAQSGTTLVIYMGLKGLERILSSLKAAGMGATTPACIIENGTLRNQKQRVATLGTLSGEGFSGPALIVIGDVVRFARAAAETKQAKAA
jgi:uroporphyrin-III C-methyltransferase